MIAKRLRVTGRVQGVGFRAWMRGRAERLGVWGWVRNTRDGAVEALVYGEVDAVEELLRLCRRGPPLAEVSAIEEGLAERPDDEGFHVLR